MSQVGIVIDGGPSRSGSEPLKYTHDSLWVFGVGWTWYASLVLCDDYSSRLVAYGEEDSRAYLHKDESPIKSPIPPLNTPSTSLCHLLFIRH